MARGWREVTAGIGTAVGTLLASQALATAGLRVVDSGGRDVGAVIGIDESRASMTVVRRIGNDVVKFNMDTKGLVGNYYGVGAPVPKRYESMDFRYEKADCSGQRYMRSHAHKFTRLARSVGTGVYYPAGAPASKTMQSFASENVSCLRGTRTEGGLCCRPLDEAMTESVGTATKLDFPALGLVLPFRLEGP